MLNIKPEIAIRIDICAYRSYTAVLPQQYTTQR